VLRVHDEIYLKSLYDKCEGGQRDKKGNLSAKSDSTVGHKRGMTDSIAQACVGVAATLQAVDAVVEGVMKNALVVVDPPGKYAGVRGPVMGVVGSSASSSESNCCLVNYVAIAAKHLIENWGFQRVSIVDIGAHHGRQTPF